METSHSFGVSPDCRMPEKKEVRPFKEGGGLEAVIGTASEGEGRVEGGPIARAAEDWRAYRCFTKKKGSWGAKCEREDPVAHVVEHFQEFFMMKRWTMLHALLPPYAPYHPRQGLCAVYTG